MPHCHHCQKPVEHSTVVCPHCRTTLKAFGHPGVPLHRASGSESLCTRCRYHDDDSCTFPQRPHATTCTLFRDRDKPSRGASPPPKRSLLSSRQFLAGAIFVAIIAIALLWALLTLR